MCVLFNHRTRQGVHDLASGSFVADADKSVGLAVLPIWKGIGAVLGTLVAVGVMRLADFPAMFADARVIQNIDH